VRPGQLEFQHRSASIPGYLVSWQHWDLSHNCCRFSIVYSNNRAGRDGIKLDGVKLAWLRHLQSVTAPGSHLLSPPTPIGAYWMWLISAKLRLPPARRSSCCDYSRIYSIGTGSYSWFASSEAVCECALSELSLHRQYRSGGHKFCKSENPIGWETLLFWQGQRQRTITKCWDKLSSWGGT